MGSVAEANVLIRVDASFAIGTGHVYRMLSLAQMLAGRGSSVAFVSRRLPGNCLAYIAACGYETHEFAPGDPGDPSWLGVSHEREVEEMHDVLRRRHAPPDWLVVDHYELGDRWERAMRAYSSHILAIDDLGRRHEADYVLDASLGTALRYPHVEPARVLSGPRFALVRPQFWDAWYARRNRSGEIRRVLVFYGGVDATGETLKAMRALLQVSEALQIDVVIGGQSRFRADIETMGHRDPRFRVLTEQAGMAELMISADLAIGAGGTASWERCFAGLPAIATAIAPNQEHVVRDLAAAGAIVSLGNWETTAEADIAAVVLRLRENPAEVRAMSQAAAALVAGFEDARQRLLDVLVMPAI